jgi:hypothetical protein
VKTLERSKQKLGFVPVAEEEVAKVLVRSTLMPVFDPEEV